MRMTASNVNLLICYNTRVCGRALTWRELYLEISSGLKNQALLRRRPGSHPDMKSAAVVPTTKVYGFLYLVFV